MSDRQDTAPPPAPVAPAPEVEPPAHAAKTSTRVKRDKPPRRHVLVRLFGIGPWGALKLAAMSVIVGFFVMATRFNPADPNVDVPGALAALARNVYGLAEWTVANFWRPALSGAAIVLPLWVLWRLVSLPFRK